MNTIRKMFALEELQMWSKHSDVFIGSLIIILISLSVFDAFASALWVNWKFADEANPLMAALMDVDLSLFLYVKLGVTFFCGICFWKMRAHYLTKYALFLGVGIYSYIFYKHAVIAYDVICFHNAIHEMTRGSW